jgi:hypothetical protein
MKINFNKVLLDCGHTFTTLNKVELGKRNLACFDCYEEKGIIKESTEIIKVTKELRDVDIGDSMD